MEHNSWRMRYFNIFILLILLSACAKQRERRLIGTWELKKVQITYPDVTKSYPECSGTYTFRKDGTYSVDVVIKEGTPLDTGKFEGSYKLIEKAWKMEVIETDQKTMQSYPFVTRIMTINQDDLQLEYKRYSNGNVYFITLRKK